MFAIREVADADLDPLRDGLVVPLPGLERDTVTFEGRDGKDILSTVAKGLEIKTVDEKRPLMAVTDIRLAVYLTESRVAFACTKYDKGGGWFGGAGAIAMNAGSKAMAMARRRGKILVGHVQYPWISFVYAQNWSRWKHVPKLRLGVKFPGDASSTLVDVSFPKDVDVTSYAHQIIRRAARFRLANEPDLTQEEIDRFNEFDVLPPLQWTKDDPEMAGVTFPTSFPVGEFGASIGLPRAESAGSTKPESAIVSESTVAVEPDAAPTVTGADPAPEPGRAPEVEAVAEPKVEVRDPAQEQVDSPPATLFCEECGCRCRSGDAYCGHCGTRLEPALDVADGVR